MNKQGYQRLRQQINHQMAEQISTCPNCNGMGKMLEFEQLESGGIREINKGECNECDSGGYGLFCAICGEYGESDELDFHHWDYFYHIGVFLCRDCHDIVHSSEDAYPKNNDEWDKVAAQNAVEELYKTHPDRPPGITKDNSNSWLVQARRCLNIPDEIGISLPRER